MAKKSTGAKKVSLPTNTRGVPGKTHKGYRQSTGKTVDDGLGFFDGSVGKNNAKYLIDMAD